MDPSTNNDFDWPDLNTPTPTPPAIPPPEEDTPTATDTPSTQTTATPTSSPSPLYNATTDCNALREFYQLTGGDQWRNNTGWRAIARRNGNSADGCSQPDVYGVTFDANGRVSRMAMNANRLVGNLPDSMGTLTGLISLNITDNANLTGNVPSDLFMLPTLTTLILSNNSFNGFLPTSFFQSTSPLQVILLDSNRLTGNLLPIYSKLPLNAKCSVRKNKFSCKDSRFNSTLCLIDPLTNCDRSTNTAKVSAQPTSTASNASEVGGQSSTRSIMIVCIVVGIALLAFLSFFGVMAWVLGRRRKRMEKVRKEALEALSKRFGGEVKGGGGSNFKFRSNSRKDKTPEATPERRWWWEEELEMDKTPEARAMAARNSSKSRSSLSEETSGDSNNTAVGSFSGSAQLIDPLTLKLNVEYTAGSAYIPASSSRDGLEHITISEGDVLIVEWKLDDVNCFGSNTNTGASGVTADRLKALRAEMSARKLAAYIIPSEDSHQSEYIAECDARRSFISGFTGSAGLAVVTLDKAALWTDGRYFLQASNQLDSNWILQKSGLPDVPTKEDWLLQVLPPSSNIGLDPTLITVASARLLSEVLAPAGHTIVPVSENLVDIVWKETRPPHPKGKIADHPVRYSGKSREEKIKEIQEQVVKKKTWGLVLSALDEICWLFNLRGSDIAYNPVFFAYALVTPTSSYLFVDESKLEDDAKKGLAAAGVVLRPYTSFFDDLKAQASKAASEKLWIDSRSSLALQEAVGGPKFVEESRSPVQTAKSIKNATEIQGFRDSHVRDAVALCEFFGWLEDELINKGNRQISEVDAATKLESFRAKLDDFIGLSFDTISSTGSNGSIIHYKPSVGACKLIDPDAVYLCDSGAQFKDGTTDVTRTMHFKNPSEFEKEAFTRVLKGHIQIDTSIFPRGTTGYVLDVLSRTSLWKGGLDFRHGTGHGVGSYLNVHEGPQGIGTRIAYNDVPLEPGMTVTNEPGYYEDGKFGIRIENVMIVKEVTTKNNFGGRGYLGFEHVTLVPIQTKMVALDLLLPEERQWLNDYNAECFKKVSPLLPKDSLGYKWLEKETQPI
ncbi:hypothetical protein HDU96_004616 [Phlyctochytrium bullatum]|nr:hypothetical protein HDU96_004616 [Phlyctochytrium bullatum]